jgi:hypothetical protein
MVITFFFLFIYYFHSLFFFFLPSFPFFISPSYTFTDSPHPLLLYLQNTLPWATRPRRGPVRTGSTASGCTSLSSPRLRKARGSASWRLTSQGMASACYVSFKTELVANKGVFDRAPGNSRSKKSTPLQSFSAKHAQLQRLHRGSAQK